MPKERAGRAARRKRASATQLYQTCRAAGTCPPDVVNKVEQTTIADQILKWGSLGVFFGGLGIGTGTGSGGRTGYVPLGGRPAAPPEPPTTVRTPLLVESTVPSVQASDSSIVPLLEGESSVLEAGGGHAPPVHGVHGGEGFHVTSTVDSTPAVVPITPAAPGSGSHISDVTFYNPLFNEPAVYQAPTAAEAAGALQSTVLDSGASESIPLHTFSIDGGAYPTTSTPLGSATRGATALRLYSRATQQVRVSDPLFLSQPSRLVTYDNPVYDGGEDTTLWFDQPSIAPAPDPAFLDIVALHRPALTKASTGAVRVSRVGQRATLRTRSGKQIGARVHFYSDLSPIGRASDPQVYGPGPLVHISKGADPGEALYDIYADPDSLEDGPSAPGAPARSFTTASPSLTASSTAAGVPSVPLTPGPDVGFPAVPAGPAASPAWPPVPFQPSAAISIFASDFYLHPSYILKRRKRVPYTFFADGIVAS
ncbi:late protein L2 [Alouatta guariba papillomavirus 1]|uniref:Minor capsid protein L2 n=1 Tax=Alouatta guariba papillomavirus 1 TaxID=1784959 RepID=A0A140CC01_9PAPI|nr:late protein L2 [Alouatta guariba papillomavirus 1]